jgi:hypothetical protein
MPTSYEDKLKEQARPYLGVGEHVLAAFVAQPRGATTAKMAGLGPGAIGGMKTSKQKRAAGGTKIVTFGGVPCTQARRIYTRYTGHEKLPTGWICGLSARECAKGKRGFTFGFS